MKKNIYNTTIEPLLSYFERSFVLTVDEKEFLKDKFHSRLFKKKQFVLEEGKICTHFNFVVSGCLRSYKIDEKGNMHIFQFAAENNWINDLGSFHSLMPSSFLIDALEDSVILQISRDDLLSLYGLSPKFDQIFRILVENAYVRLQERLMQNISSSADDRYNSFLSVYPHLSNRIPQLQIAAFLGISPEFLSRLRNPKNKH